MTKKRKHIHQLDACSKCKFFHDRVKLGLFINKYGKKPLDGKVSDDEKRFVCGDRHLEFSYNDLKSGIWCDPYTLKTHSKESEGLKITFKKIQPDDVPNQKDYPSSKDDYPDDLMFPGGTWLT